MIYVLYLALLLLGVVLRSWFRIQIMATVDAGKYAAMLDENYQTQLEERRKMLDFWFGLCSILYIVLVLVLLAYSCIYFNWFDLLGLLQ
jgi:hypothetical protein